MQPERASVASTVSQNTWLPHLFNCLECVCGGGGGGGVERERERVRERERKRERERERDAHMIQMISVIIECTLFYLHNNVDVGEYIKVDLAGSIPLCSPGTFSALCTTHDIVCSYFVRMYQSFVALLCLLFCVFHVSLSFPLNSPPPPCLAWPGPPLSIPPDSLRPL